MTNERELEVVVYGATGFTGGLVAASLAREGGVRFGIAGRNPEKLARLGERLGEISGQSVPQLVASSDEPEALRALAARTRAVVSAAGPFAKFGEPLVAACVQQGTHYADITGEANFVSEVREKHHAAASDGGIKIVNCCGLDCVPHDLGAWFTVRQLPTDVPITLEGFVRARGGVSGGTLASALNGMAQRRVGKSPPTPLETFPARGVKKGLHWESAVGAYAVPLPTVDPLVVLRSARTVGYGPDFRYGHYAAVKTKRYLLGGALVIGGAMLGAQIPPVRRWISNRRPPGFGPTPEEMERGWFTVTFLARAGDITLRTEVHGNRDAGYAMTADWLAQAGLSLVRDPLPERHGVLTTVSGLGQAYFDRVVGTGVTFSVIGS